MKFLNYFFIFSNFFFKIIFRIFLKFFIFLKINFFENFSAKFFFTFFLFFKKYFLNYFFLWNKKYFFWNNFSKNFVFKIQLRVVGLRHLLKLYKRIFWKKKPERVTASYLKYIFNSRSILSSVEHVKFGVNLGGPPSKAKKNIRSIVNKYREGKVKRTPGRGVK